MHYEEAFLLAAQISKFKMGVKIPYQIEDELRTMFKRIQRPYQQFQGKRKSFLNFRYVMVQFLNMLGYDAVAKGLPVLKSRPRLQEHDSIFANICKSLGWVFSPLLPPKPAKSTRVRKPYTRKAPLQQRKSKQHGADPQDG
jgi:hypothetical protein